MFFRKFGAIALPLQGDMKRWFCYILLSGFLLSGAYGTPVAVAQMQPASSLPQDLENDAPFVTIIYLGETHDRLADHEAQFQLIQHLYALHPDLAIGMEMFQRPYQGLLTQYLESTLLETDLRDRSEFDIRWGYPWEYYAPILRFAQEFHLPVVALNVPTEVTRYIAQNGLEELEPDLAQWIPGDDDLKLGPPAYQTELQSIYNDIHQGNSYSLSFETFFLAQIVWDETMAMAIADYVQAHPTELLVVLAGQGHINYGYGIPNRVARRLEDMEEFKQRSILIHPTAAQRAEGQGVIADYFWTLPENEGNASS